MNPSTDSVLSTNGPVIRSLLLVAAYRLVKSLRIPSLCLIVEQAKPEHWASSPPEEVAE
jgi:hypothetical protein